MRARDIPLLLASDIVIASDERYPLDSVRMQKAVFLLSMRGTDKLRKYDFTPYNWGPYSGDLTRDVSQLLHVDMLVPVSELGHRYLAYKTSYSGELRAAEVWDELTAKEQNFVRAVRSYVTNKSFEHLLREVYAEYPQYATRSQFTG
jgi:uncharacterized protein YwgA